jgi:ankyrin repeat protein
MHRGQSALSWAFDLGLGDIALRLIEHGATNLPNRKGVTPLMRASAEDEGQVVEALLRRGARVDVADDDGMTALHFAGRKGCSALLETLLSAGADVSTKDGRGHDAVYWALVGRNARALASPIKAGAPLDRRYDPLGLSALMLCRPEP